MEVVPPEIQQQNLPLAYYKIFGPITVNWMLILSVLFGSRLVFKLYPKLKKATVKGIQLNMAQRVFLFATPIGILFAALHGFKPELMAVDVITFTITTSMYELLMKRVLDKAERFKL